jgi:GTPase SAR1 family protein
LLLLGESSVGKTSLVNRYTNHTFESNNLLTIGIEVKKIMKQMGGKKIRLERKTNDSQFGTPLANRSIAPSLFNTTEASKAYF